MRVSETYCLLQTAMVVHIENAPNLIVSSIWVRTPPCLAFRLFHFSDRVLNQHLRSTRIGHYFQNNKRVLRKITEFFEILRFANPAFADYKQPLSLPK